MKAIKLLLLLTLIMPVYNIGHAQQLQKKEFVPKAEGATFQLPHIRVVPIKDTKTERNYELYIKLPEDYAEKKEKKYPVLYFTDAIWHIEILSAATEYMLEDVILVGISWQKYIKEELKAEVGDHVSRFRDYSFRESNKPEIQNKYQLGQAKKHLDFIRNDVIDYIDKHYRTDQNSRTYFGYSMGGEFGAYILLTQPDSFNNYILGSPSIKNEVPYLKELHTKFGPYEASDKNTSMKANVYITYGTLEKEMIEPIDAFVRLLKDRRDPGLAILKEVVEGDHQSGFPRTALRSVDWLASLLNPVSGDLKQVSFWDVPYLNNAFIKTAPENRKDGISVGELSEHSTNTDPILKLSQEIAAGEHGNYDALLIAHKNQLVFESYYKKGRVDLPHPQASATKVYTCLAVGRAIQLGYLSMEDLNKPVIDFLKNLDRSKLKAGAEKITLAKAMTMRSGIRISEEDREEMEKDSIQLIGQGQIQSMIAYSDPITDASQTFKYQSDPEFAMQVLDAVVPGSAKDFIKREVLDPLGIVNYKWLTAPSGLPEAGWRVSMTSRDMLKWGILVQNKGKWEGEQMIPEAYIKLATSRILLTGDDDIFGGGDAVSKQGYGYFWWNADLQYGGKTYFCRSAQGGGGQYIILIEELDLLVVVTGHDNDNKTLQLTAEHILPAFLKEEQRGKLE